MNELVDKIITDELNFASKVIKIDKLHGDASYRTYSRIHLSDGSSLIMMQMPKGKSSPSEEITNCTEVLNELPFINMDRYLKKIGLNVPEILRYNDNDKIMVLEDLGDKLLSTCIEGLDSEALNESYKNAVDLLIEIQKQSDDNISANCIAFKRSFDAKLLNWEFDHFLEYGLEARGVELSRTDLDEFKRQTRSITEKIEGMKYGLTLRDYQSRNIIIKNGTFFIIDFQDALMGPKLYDLVSLLRDSYIELDNDLLFHLIGNYAKGSGRSEDQVREEFDLITIQRKLKDSGRFVYIDRVKGNPNYLEFIPTSLEYVVQALTRTSGHETLLTILKKYTPELKRSIKLK
ncbi:MAG: phosphotransferase [Deltaproteobacteria bacterium]|jgi:N-acetylmuramate 1-kinase|nr:phosphotransferase [Deltaproteobacteria bacterium]